ncbi:cysteine--tRNA ligase [Bradyrhizobium oligotrophicum]|uniref:cysteine--tRNA ligase n=1 Tax=Bradyrhizobium oligotrophicum TaxID=44255 RepID=UPI003EBBE818
MDLRLYDTASREKRAFVPLDPKNVRMYVCGPTVYDFAHIGNARPVIVFDVLFRLLRHLYGADHVTYVRNITDVDDKINARAARDFPGLPLNEAIRKVTEVTADQFHSDTTALGSLPPTFEPRATDFVLPRPDGKADMVTLIRQLIARGHAYEAGGEVLFDTQSMPDYGALSGRRLDEQLAGARVAVDAHKKHPADFVLWKQSSEDEPGWDSPWGRGRPGWHIECSAMSAAYLGEIFDIHGGGLDLIFPHHENEIAQSRCAHGTQVMANYWLHNEFVQVEGAKMSKSLGNFVTIRDLLADWPGEVLRLNMLKMHYRSPADWTVKGLEESAKTLDDWYRVAADVPGEQPEPAVISALLDDINTPLMIAELHALRSRAASGGDAERAAFAGSLRYAGFLSETATQWEARKQEARGVDAAQVEILIGERTAARARKDFKESDRLRDKLAAMGVVLKDGKGPDGKPVTTWEIAR